MAALVAGVAVTLGFAAAGGIALLWTSAGCTYRNTPIRHAGTDARVWRTAALSWQEKNGTSACPTPRDLRSDKSIDPDQSELDPWGVAYLIECAQGADVSVRSFGADRSARTSDDIVVPAN
jgi:hypothetical protein